LYGNPEFKSAAEAAFEIDLARDYTVLFGIFPEEVTELDSIFTLFAKVDFLERHESLQGLGFDVRYCLIP